MSVVTLTTDFSATDWFVGTMKGVVLGINPRATLVDLTHEVPPGDIHAGAFALRASYRFFPEGTVHLAVVDPGVGSARKAVAVRTAKYCFVGPDNGVLSWALAQEEIVAAHELRNERFFLSPVSRTFHGRDIFAPAAAHISRGLSLRQVGPALDDFMRLPWPQVCRAGEELRGEVVYVDRFGNAITNLAATEIASLGDPGKLTVMRGTKRLCPLADSYSAVAAGAPVAVLGSSGLLEIAVNRGNAARRLRLRVGTTIAVGGNRSRQ